MAKHISEFDGWLDQYNWPRVACPTCDVGSLGFDQTKMTTLHDVAGAGVVELAHKNMGPPDELEGTFHGHLKCDNSSCGETVTIAGDWQLVFNNGEYPEHGQFGNIYRIRYVNPALKLMTLPEKTPQKVVDGVTSAARVLWVSPSSAANRLRYAAEELLTAQGVPATKPGNNYFPLDQRIKEYKKTQPDLAKALLAVKYIGNEGSHDELLTAKQVLEGVEIFDHVITALYDTKAAAMAAKIKAINDAKGVLNTP